MLRVAEQYAATDTGLARRANEDSLLARSPLFVVADGMGGAQAGEVASRLAIETFEELDGDFAEPADALSAFAQTANARIFELAHDDPAHAGMGTTVTAVYVGPEEVTVAHVGDSRAYRLRDGQLLRLTDDHSLVDELIRQGRLTPEEAEEHPQRSIITRALGPEASVEVDTRSLRACDGDLYMLCSDGLTSMVGERDLALIMSEQTPLKDTGEALIAAANAAGGRDNVTVVLLRVEEVGEIAGGRREPATLVGLTRAEGIVAGAAAEGAAPRARAPEGEGAALATRERPIARRVPRQGEHRERPRRRRGLRRIVIPAAVLVVLVVLASAAYLTMQSVYFVGTNADGLVTIYQGVPYQLPGKLNLYTVEYVSGVSASSLSPARRRTLLDESLRSEANAGELVRKLELGEIAGG
ncbi:MAG: Stp1/IreP family PP2C-type Ser/Thr phosphatase [Solirubrobacteraceae bacterium]